MANTSADGALTEGMAAPDFAIATNGGEDVTLRALRGQYAIVFFYPKDDTPGCTKEAIEFSQAREALNALGAVAIGISKDSLASHEKFARKHNLTIALGSDEELRAITAYGVWSEKKNYGKVYMGVERSTFLIAPDGTIARIWRKVRVPGHVEAVLTALRELQE
jgi:thioredoxin-dependent peroxiredoxin